MRDAVDFVVAPDPGLLAQLNLDALPYTGNARPPASWFSDMKAVGLPVLCMIQETVSTRSQQGFQAGVYDCQFAESRAREVNPDIKSIAVVVSDGNSADNWDASEYGRGWASVATLRFFPYGAVPICESFIRGAVGPLIINGTWVPETWGQGTLISQVVGPSPIPNTDLNHVHSDYTGGSPSQEEEEMTFWMSLPDGGQWTTFMKDGVLYKHHVSGPESEALKIAAFTGQVKSDGGKPFFTNDLNLLPEYVAPVASNPTSSTSFTVTSTVKPA